jgi:hypothetical protein
VRNRIASFVLPIGYSFNLDGSMMYCTFATVFIAQAYGIEMPLSTQLVMMGVLMLTSKGIAGVPRASLPVQHPGGGPAAVAGHRPLPGHGPFRHQRDRQQRGRCGRGQMGR